MQSLVGRLSLVICVALAPALVFEGYAELQARRARQLLMHDEASRLVRLVAGEERQIFAAADQLLTALARAPSIAREDGDHCGPLLAAVVEELPRYLTANVFRLDGQLICGTRPATSAFNVLDHPYFRQALATDGFVVGNLTLGRISGQPALHVARSFRDTAGAVGGVVTLAFSAAWLQHALEQVPLPPGATACVLGRDGRILARVPAAPGYVGSSEPEGRRRALEADETTVLSVTGIDGIERLIGSASIGSTGLRVEAGLAPDIAFAVLRRDNQLGVVLIVAGMAFALAASLLLARRLISLPVNRLLETAARWAAGDLAARTGLAVGRGEFSRLAAAFDGMAGTLAGRERALHTALESTTDAVIVLDREWRYTYMNGHAKRLNGGDLTGQIIWEANPETVGTPLYHALQTAMLSGQPVQADAYSVALKRHLQTNSYPSDAGLTVFCRDLTEQRRLAAALQESEARLQLACEAAQLGVWDHDYIAGTNVWSESQWRFHELEPREVGPETADWLPKVHPEDLETLLSTRAAKRVSLAERDDFAYRILLADGSVRWLQISMKYIRTGDGIALRAVGVSRDVTAQREAEAALRLATERFELALKATPIALFSQDRELRYTWTYNPQLTPADEQIGRTDGEVFLRAEDAALTTSIKRQVMRSGVGQRREIVVLGPRGDMHYDLLVEPLRDERDEIAGVTCAAIDITEHTRIAAELRDISLNLEKRVRQEVAAREAAQTRAAHAERMQALGRLAGGIAHDFNNVLQGIIFVISLIRRTAEDHAAVRRHAALALEAGERGAAITRRLLGFARRSNLEVEPVDAADLLAGMHELLAHTLGPNITVGITAADDLPLMLADRGRLETTLVNLGTNARDAMTEGGHLHFMAEADSATRTDFPHWAGLASGAYIRLSVIDTGSGMDAATLAQAGEPFFTTKGLGAGTGLGLSMAKAFAEQSGGALRIASAPGEGTTIALWLPAARETADAPPRARTLQKPSQAAVSRGSRQVLLVDDDRIIRDSLDLHLRDAGFSVVRAASGSEAVGLLDRGLAVDALVTDLAMPDLDGLAVIRAAQQRHPRLPAILLTGFAGDDGAAAMGGAMQGSFSLLRKPVQENQLIERLQALLAEGD